MGYLSVAFEGLVVLVSPNFSDRKGNNKVSNCKLKNCLLGENNELEKKRRILLLDDYY